MYLSKNQNKKRKKKMDIIIYEELNNFA